MRYRVFGRDAVSKEPRAPLFVEADSEEAARNAAASQGLEAEEIEPIGPRAAGTGNMPRRDVTPAQQSAYGFGTVLLVIGLLVFLGAFIAVIVAMSISPPGFR